VIKKHRKKELWEGMKWDDGFHGTDMEMWRGQVMQKSETLMRVLNKTKFGIR
jgi:hypothetical protein